MKLLIYVPILSPRIKYIFSFIFNDVLRTEIDFTVDAAEFVQSALPKFSYAEQPLGNELFFKSTALLFEHKIVARQIQTIGFGEMKVPFPVTSSELPFDVFAASFYFLSRYEEYVHANQSADSSYPFGNSLQYHLNLLELPVIDGWALLLKNILLKHFPVLSFEHKTFSFLPLHLLDQPEKSAGKPFIHKVGTFLRNFIKNTMHIRRDKPAAIKQFLIAMQNEGVAQNASLLIPREKTDGHFFPELQIPKSYVSLTRNKAENDYSMYYSGYPGFRAGTCTPFYWYDLQLEKKTQLLLHPVATTDTSLLNNKTAEVLLLKLNELINSVKLVNGNFYFLSLRHDI